MADGVIDSLSIEIGASSNKAVKNINALVTAMKALKDAASHIDNSAAGKISALASAMKELGDSKKVNISSKLGENLSKLAGSMKAIKSEDISKLRQVASAVKTLDGTKGININSKLADNIFNVAAAADSLTKTHADNLRMFGEALHTLGGGKLNIGDKLPDQLTNIATAMEGITDEAIDRLRRMAEALSNLRGVNLQGFSGAVRTARQQTQTPTVPQNSGTQQVDSEEGASRRQIEWTFNLRENIKLVDQEWLHVGKTIENIGAKIAGIDPRIKAIISVVRALGSALKNIASFVLDIAKGIAKWSFNTAVNMVKRLGQGIKSVAKGVADFGKNMVKNMYDSSALKSLIDSFSRIKSIISTFGRIAFYRAVRSAIKYVTDALQKGTENAYWFSKKFGEATAYISEAYDNLSSSNFKMSNQLGAAWSTMIATIEPILIRLIELVTRAVDAITQFFAALSGKTVYMRAIDYTKDWADETDKGAQKAKEWKNQLMGFDEINRLESPSDSSKSGKTELYKDYENMFEEVEVDGIFKKIRELIDSNQWDKLGILLGNKFNDLVNRFDWSGWGTKIGKGIQHGIDLAYNFLGTANFQNLGSKIAELINSAGDEINFEQLGRTTRRIRLAIWNVLYGAITTLDWSAWAARISVYIIGSLNELADWISKLDTKQIAKAIKDFFGNIKYEEIRDSFVTLIRTAWKKAIELKDELFDEETKTKMSSAIRTFFSGLPWEDIKDAIAESVKTAWQLALALRDVIWNDETKADVTKAISEFFGNLTWDDVKETIKGKLTEVWKFVGDRVDEIWPEESRKEFYETVWGWFKELGSNIGSSIWEGFKETDVGKVLIALYEISAAIEDFMNPASSLFDSSKKFSDTWTLLSGAIKAMKNDSERDFGDIENKSGDVENALTDLSNTASNSINGIGEDVKTTLQNVDNEINTQLKPTESTITDSLGNIKTSSYDATTALTEMSGVSISSLSSDVTSSGFGIVNAMYAIRDAAMEAWNWLTSVFSASNAGSYTYDLPNGNSFHYNPNHPGFASGGFPEDGLFFANHGELVGKFSNGKTAVANNEQITEGIASAVYEAFTTAFQQTGGNNDKEVNIYLDGEKIAKSTTRYQRQYARATG